MVIPSSNIDIPTPYAMKVATPEMKSVRCACSATTDRKTGSVHDSEATAADGQFEAAQHGDSQDHEDDPDCQGQPRDEVGDCLDAGGDEDAGDPEHQQETARDHASDHQGPAQ